MDAANHSVSDHSGTHRAWRIELRERVKNGEPQVEAPLFFLQLVVDLEELYSESGI